MNSFVQIFLKLGNSLKLFNHFQKQPPEVVHKESHSQTFCDILKSKLPPRSGSSLETVEPHP